MSAKFLTDLDFKNPIWNRDTWARLQGNVDPEKEKIANYSGVVLGVQDGAKATELVGFEGFACTRLLPQEDGSYRRLNKETIFYRDLRTGELLDEWTNPWTGEKTNVVHVANDPFNYNISEWLILAPEDFNTKDGKKPEPRKFPLLFPWKKISDKYLTLATDMHLYYPNPLQPDKWQRESSGAMAQVSEMFRYFVPIEDVLDETKTTIHCNLSWSRITPWLPWMLLGQQSGHCLYIGAVTTADTVAEIVPQDMIDYCEKHWPHMLYAPKEDYGPSHSSLEYYGREQEPAPPLKD
jgi:hypothetical protein